MCCRVCSLPHLPSAVLSRQAANGPSAPAMPARVGARRLEKSVETGWTGPAVTLCRGLALARPGRQKAHGSSRQHSSL